MILVVDDDLDFLDEVSASLEPSRGVLFAPDAAHAVELVGSIHGLAVALVDLDLPGTDGFTLIQNLHKTHPNLPTIAMSGVFQRHVLESAMELGATAVLRKPITGEWKSVVDRVRNCATQ